MKGMVFTEFIEMVESRFGLEIADDMIINSASKSNGVYTTVGTYDHVELVRMLQVLSQKTDTSMSQLLFDFGKYMFDVFSKNYHQLFLEINSSFEFLSKVDSYIHVEVKKLYPDAQLPKFEILSSDQHHMVLLYHSQRKLSDMAHGLMIGCIQYFKEDITIKKEVLDANGANVKFTLNRK